VTGSDYIAAFLARMGVKRVYTLTGGACAFMIDAVARHPELDFICLQHEQAAAMAADAVWRVSGRMGVTMATSGPGATNLITGIASSFFDSIPSMHITGQVNQRESNAFLGTAVRQTGFQETKIVEMVRPIVKYAVMVRSPEELRDELARAWTIAMAGRMGPVLIDVPMDVQQAEVPGDMLLPDVAPSAPASPRIAEELTDTLSAAKRPVVLWGAGIGRAGVEKDVLAWLDRSGLPFVSSWAGLSAFDHNRANFMGQIGVYGNRGANFLLQNADAVIVLGSRLDNRQRSGNTANFARGAVVHVLDVDPEELKKYASEGYRVGEFDFAHLPGVLASVPTPTLEPDWTAYIQDMRKRYYGREKSSSARRLNSLSPYEVVRRINASIEPDAIVAGDTGAAICWLHQAFQVKNHTLFTSGGNSPMGYALPASIGSKLEAPDRQVVSYNGDGGFQLNLQELQTIKAYGLDIAVVIMNNSSYGIIKQFQDSYLGSRYSASLDGYSTPDFAKIAEAYGLRYVRIETPDQITPAIFEGGAVLIDVVLSEDTLIEPKLEMGRPINDQFPYLPTAEYEDGNRFVAYPRPETMRGLVP
jgi:acetolactate synthase I/II/III large subunit